ncbi:MAG: ribosome small subunit-dependent GTPase A [Oscillospiraceae bacterium]
MTEQTSQTLIGRIVRATGGFYYLDRPGSPLECRARGLFRKQGINPVVGDMAEAAFGEDRSGYLLRILPRKNALTRPQVANVDRLLLVLSAVDPPPNLRVVDRMLAIAEYKDVDAAIIVTKRDLGVSEAEKLCALYAGVGYVTVDVDAKNGSVDVVRPLLEGRLCVLAGNTGAGKSTLLNALDPTLSLLTGETSRKLGRGRHTTRTTELFPVAGGFLADTPGFSSLETMMLERIRRDEVALCFREFSPYRDNCRFTGCSHQTELGCAVLEALHAGKITPSRHESYLDMLQDAKQIKDWEA